MNELSTEELAANCDDISQWMVHGVGQMVYAAFRLRKQEAEITRLKDALERFRWEHDSNGRIGTAEDCQDNKEISQ